MVMIGSQLSHATEPLGFALLILPVIGTVYFGIKEKIGQKIAQRLDFKGTVNGRGYKYFSFYL